jgi:hypothetical protein
MSPERCDDTPAASRAAGRLGCDGVTVLALVAPAGALAQGDPFAPLPPPAPEPTPQPPPDQGTVAEEASDVTRTVLFLVGGALLIVFIAIGFVITRDARRSLPESARPTDGLREEGPHKHSRQAKAKARKKGRAQRKARRVSRRKAR